jgi:hypothetical protein
VIGDFILACNPANNFIRPGSSFDYLVVGGGGGASRNASATVANSSGGKGGSGIAVVRYLGDPVATGGTISAGTGDAAG